MDDIQKSVRCAHCGRLTDPGNFCQRCGKLLSEEVVQQKDGSKITTEKFVGFSEKEPEIENISSIIKGAGEESIRDVPACPPDAEPVILELSPINKIALSERDEISSSALSGVPCGTSGAGSLPDCPLRIEYNFARAFVVGQMYPFEFNIRALREGVDRVAIGFWCSHYAHSLPPDLEITARVGRAYSIPWSIMFAPEGETIGQLAIRIYIGWREAGDDEWHWLYSTVSHRIYPAQMPARELAEKLVVNIEENINIHGGHANDVTVRNVVGDVHRIAEQMDHGSKAISIIDKLSALKLYNPLALIPSRPPIPIFRLPDAPPPAAARISALTLHYNGWRFHLLGQNTASFGRQREVNDLVLRVMGSDGRIDTERSVLISKKHGTIEYRGSRCVIRDNSSLGTAVDGRMLKKGDVSELSASGVHKLALAAGGNNGRKAMQLELSTYNCNHALLQEYPHAGNCPGSVPASLQIRRTDDLKESYMFVWRCGLLGKMISGLMDATVYRVDGAFQLRRPGRPSTWLIPGQQIEYSAGKYLTVSNYEQIKLTSR